MWDYLLHALIVSLAVNIALFLVAFRYRTDKLTDASYGLTFMLLAASGLAAARHNTYAFLLFTMVILWACRLGGFLLFRIWHTGKDGRFDDIRSNFRKFGMFWVSQGMSVWMIMLPALLALRSQHAQLDPLTCIGLLVWALGVGIEATADIQKYRFNTNPANKGQWIESGIWRYSRHPNYLGEIMVWIGVYLFAWTALNGLERFIGLASPLFISCLLLFISGIPPLEKSADERWGKDAKYRAYKAKTSILLLLPRKK